MKVHIDFKQIICLMKSENLAHKPIIGEFKLDYDKRMILEDKDSKKDYLGYIRCKH